MELIELLLAFAAGCWLGFRVNEAMMAITFKKMIEEAGITPKDLRKFHDKFKGEFQEDSDPELDVIEIRIEKHKDCLYAFRKDNDQFLGQGATKEDLIRRLGEKIRGTRLTIAEGDGSEFIGGAYNFDCTTKEINEVKRD